MVQEVVDLLAETLIEGLDHAVNEGPIEASRGRVRAL